MKNKVTTKVRERIEKIFDDNIDSMQSDIEQLEPKEMVKFMIDILPYLAPRLQATTVTPEPEPVTIHIIRGYHELLIRG